MKMLVTGAKGQLGSDIVTELFSRGIKNNGVDFQDFDITDKNAVDENIKKHMPNAVIHCAAYTAVDKAEDEPEICERINAGGTRNIAEACKKIGAKMLYISTDYVFPGTGEDFYKPYDETCSSSVYGQTKLAGEKAVQEILNNYYIVRISWLYGKKGNNFVKTMLRLGKEFVVVNVVNDQIGSPTYTVDLAPLICDIAASDKFGIYHATNEGECSWAEFAQGIFDFAGLKTKVNPIPTVEYPIKAKRPYNSRLDKTCLDDAGFKRLPHWKDALQRYCS